MIPFGPIYRELRSLMLAVFPEDMPAPGSSGVNFSKWIESGAYLVSRHDAKGVCLVVSQQDIAVAMLRDVEFLVDSCFEQLLEVLTQSTSANRSAAWGVVTGYYYAFFAAQALSRIIGRPVTYLDDVRVATIKAIASTPMTLGAGSFSAAKVSDLSASQAEFEFRKSKLRPHDAVWKSVFHLLVELRTKHRPAPRSSDLAATQEFQLFDALTSSRPFEAFVGGDYNWPSEVRYEANYRVGNAYTMLRDPWQLQPYLAMKGWRNVTKESALTVVRTALSDLDSEDSIQGLKSRVSVLLNAGNTIFALVRSLQIDLYGRRTTDARWEDRRKRFCNKHAGVFEDKTSWLFPKN